MSKMSSNRLRDANGRFVVVSRPHPNSVQATSTSLISPNAKGPKWVVSRLLVNSYLESVPRSHYGGKAVVQQMGIITPVIITVLPGTAISGNGNVCFGFIEAARKQTSVFSPDPLIADAAYGHNRTYNRYKKTPQCEVSW